MRPKLFLPIRRLAIVTLLLSSVMAACAGDSPVDSITEGADFRPARIFSDNMVLQCDMAVPVWGWSEVDQTVTVRFNGQQISTEARSGERWQIRLAPMSAHTEPQSLVIHGSKSDQEVILANVLVGDVWLCMGQSNMEMIMGAEETGDYLGVLNHEEELKDTDYTQLRLLNIPKTGANFPAPDIAVQWHTSTPKTAEFFSAVAYTFGRELHRDTNIPIGLINVSMGGAYIKRFLPREVQILYPELYSQSIDSFTEQWKKIEAAANQSGITGRQAIKDWNQSVIAYCADAEAQPPSPEWRNRNYALPEFDIPLGQGLGSMYYGMIAPLVPYGIKGFVWYQGESDLADGEAYGPKISAWVNFLRNKWRGDDLAFFAVEITPYNYHESDWPMKNAPLDQRDKLNRGIRAILRLPNTGIVSTEDLNQERTSLHPRNKAPIGRRLADLAISHLKQAPHSNTHTNGE